MTALKDKKGFVQWLVHLVRVRRVVHMYAEARMIMSCTVLCNMYCFLIAYFHYGVNSYRYAAMDTWKPALKSMF